MDCESELELEGLCLRCQLSEHVGLHSVKGEKFKTNEQGEVEKVFYKVSWREQRAGVDSEEAFVEMLEWLSAA